MGATNLMLMAFSAAMSYKDIISQQISSHTYKGNVGSFFDQPGFDAFDSKTFYKTAKASTKLGGKLIDMIYSLSMEDFPNDFDNFQKEQWKNFFIDIKEEQSYEIDTASMSINAAQYSNKTGLLNFNNIFLTPDDDGEVVTYEYLRIQSKMSLPGRFMIGSFSSNSEFSSRLYLNSTDSKVSQRDVVDALSIAIAPIYLGLLNVSPTLLEKMKSIGNVSKSIEANPICGFT
ncbi:hypothetical protein TRFO_01726 [Tritrichomonas foetus]|uniref:Uncharacterized protein n=1 Tax=Tritrichomonas foetus TaxID=1144522 RepID=A0A1J4JPU6_9EUKA|nr:hypothetical protein TRFO_01726 [Tritrichomonas foetus]|eukprot:OHT01129.1 hypothetical protein TRFO_01726 [Tritrichomonas foetus]